MLRTRGKDIINAEGKVTPLRGFCIGSWLMMESTMLGFPGAEQQFRGFLEYYAGEEKAKKFFDNLLDAFIQEEDIKLMKEMGCTAVRVPFNYRHFESDNEPFKYKEEGFKHLDRLGNICKKYNIYIILDMHSVPGLQNFNWHSDNPEAQCKLYQEPIYQERTKELWKYIADHYKNEEIIAGYDLMNEPTAFGEFEISALNRIYKETTKSIREVDKNHIIFIKGNLWGRSFDGIDAPFDDNLVYSCHFYTDPLGVSVSYPRFKNLKNMESRLNQVSPTNGAFFNFISNKALLEQQMDARDEFMRIHNVPCWVGEFGLPRGNPLYEEDGKRVLIDQLNIFNERGHSWTFWSYKDLNGFVYLPEDSKWMKVTEKFRYLCEKYNCNFDGQAGSQWELGNLLKPFYYFDFKDTRFNIDAEIRHQLSLIFSKGLTDMFAKELSALAEEELMNLTFSFLYKNCKINTELKEILIKHLK